MAVPGNPAITSAAVGDEEVTLTLTADDPGDVIYARYRAGGQLPNAAWNAENETDKRTGDGTIVISGLTNGTGYRFGIYAKDGTETSDWDIAFQAPEDPALVADSLLSLPVVYLRESIAASANFQAAVGAANPTEAKASIHLIAFESAWALPHCIIGTTDGMNIPDYTDETHGMLIMILQDGIDTTHTIEEAFNAFTNWIGKTITDIRNLSRAGGYLNVINITPVGPGAQRPDPREKQTIQDPEGNEISDFYQAIFTVEYQDI